MTLKFAPLLSVQREIYQLPLGPERFQRYIQTITNEAGDGVELAPLVAMNPMGKPHCAELLDQYLALDADAIAERALREILPTLEPGELPQKAALVLVDDLKGGWTNRTACEYNFRVPEKVATDWLSICLWTSEAPSVDAVQNAARVSLRRAIWLLQSGSPKTLGEILCQERFADAGHAPLPDDEREYVAHVLTPLLETPATDMPVVVAALFGDDGAAALGYPPLGLEKNAGLRLASSGFPQE